MAQCMAAADRVSLEHLLGELVRDGRRLLAQQVNLFSTEAGAVRSRAVGRWGAPDADRPGGPRTAVPQTTAALGGNLA
jgi:hypothetical protein